MKVSTYGFWAVTNFQPTAGRKDAARARRSVCAHMLVSEVWAEGTAGARLGKKGGACGVLVWPAREGIIVLGAIS